MDDLKAQASVRNQVVPDQMEFSYNFGSELKIDVDAAKLKQADRAQKEKAR